MGWQFPKNISIDEIKPLFLGVRDGATFKIEESVVVDNCCTIRHNFLGIKY